MPNITGLTLEQLRAMTRAQILSTINGFFSPLTKRQLIVWLLEAEAVQARQIIDYWPDGQVKLITDILQDIETGNRISGRKTQFTYFDTHEIHFIRVKNYDANNNELIGQGWQIEHFLDGREPVKTVI